ncbi:MAG: ribonuclease J [Armatimonadetes bacterium]|nr:ribonuclease J [Armatimonadota bacterium]
MSSVRVIPLGGVGEIGKNCTVIEQDDDIIVLDCGLSFPTEEMPGIDIVIPDFTYLLENKDRVRGIFITHAHEDHVGALPYLLKELNVPLYASEFTHALIRNKLDEKLDTKKLDLRTYKGGDILKAGSLSVEPIRITHSIPENYSLAVRTKHGIVLLTSDFKLDFTPVDGKQSNLNRFAEIGKEGVVLLLSDSTNVERPGWGPSEQSVKKELEAVLAAAEGRVLLTTFASNIHRMQQFFEAAADVGRKVAIVGRRMEQNVEICSQMKFIRIPKGTQIRLDEMKQYPDDKVAILTTGSQGEPMSALVQMSRGEYGRLQIRAGDTLIYSARPIPGNEGAIWRTINRLFRQGCKVMYGQNSNVHVSGHAYQEELKTMINLTQPYYLAPVHGEPRHQEIYLQMARAMGYPEHRLFELKDGDCLVLEETSAAIMGGIQVGRVLVDNSGRPGVPDEVLRDRRNLANDGVVSVTVVVDIEQGEIVGDTMISARGFHGPEGSLEKVTEVVDHALDALSREEVTDVSRVRHEVADSARRFIQHRYQLRPLVLVNIAEI